MPHMPLYTKSLVPNVSYLIPSQVHVTSTVNFRELSSCCRLADKWCLKNLSVALKETKYMLQQAIEAKAEVEQCHLKRESSLPRKWVQWAKQWRLWQSQSQHWHRGDPGRITILQPGFTSIESLTHALWTLQLLARNTWKPPVNTQERKKAAPVLQTGTVGALMVQEALAKLQFSSRGKS